jgi:hypothetical protein
MTERRPGATQSAKGFGMTLLNETGFKRCRFHSELASNLLIHIGSNFTRFSE